MDIKSLTDFIADEIFDTSFLVNVQIKGLESLKFRNINNYWPKNRTRHLKCKGNNCEEFTVVHLGWLDYSHYQFLVNFYGLNNKRYSITKLTFYVSSFYLLRNSCTTELKFTEYWQIKTFNPAFTSLEISFRLIFLFFAFIVCIWYYTLLRRHPSTNWSIEQKFTYVLLPLLILYDSKEDFCFGKNFLLTNIFPRRSIVSVDVLGEFLVRRDARCDLPVDIPLHPFVVLVSKSINISRNTISRSIYFQGLNIPRAQTKREEILDLLFAKAFDSISNLALCSCSVYLGETRWDARSNLDTFLW